MPTDRYDIAWREHGPSIEPHFCREWDETGGCYGTNPDHGMSLEDACASVADWHEEQARLYRSGEHPSLRQLGDGQ